MTELVNQVQAIARQVGQAILPYFSQVNPEVKEDGSWLTEADTLAHKSLFKALPEIVDVPVLSEELSEQEQLQIIDTASEGYWCIDPLDGTSNFTQGISYWAVSIALIQNGVVKLGVVYDPNRDECFCACDDQPSTINDKVITVGSTTKLSDSMGLIDLKRIPGHVAAELVKTSPYRSQRSFGACALDLCWIAADRCQLYLHGQQRLWDYAAASKILLNASGQLETFDGQTLFQNDLPSKTVIAASTEHMMSLWRTYFLSLYHQNYGA